MKKKLSFTYKLLITLIVPLAWYYMLTRGMGMLAAKGILSLRYFTVLSNLLMGVAALAALLFREKPRWVRRLQYAGAASVGLTFLVVMVFLGPLYGYPGMFRGANLWFHLIVPLLAMVGFVLFEEGCSPTIPESLLATVPMLLYGVWYGANLMINGVEGNDVYGFTIFGMAYVPLVFLVIFLLVWGIALLLRFFRKKL